MDFALIKLMKFVMLYDKTMKINFLLPMLYAAILYNSHMIQ